MTTSQFSRRDFLKATSLAALAASGANAQAVSKKPNFPFVDGLCLDFLDEPSEIRASGLTAFLTDMSKAESVPTADGSPKWTRTLAVTIKNMVAARQVLRKRTDSFLATSGSQIKEAFKTGQTAVFFQVQGGGEIVGEDLSRIDLLNELGLRVLQITHHDNNPLGGGGLESVTTGLTKLGFEAIERMNSLNVIPDLSHSSDQTGFDTLKTSKKPVILSHGAARAIVNNARCAPDEVIRGIANSGGVMGVFMMSFWLTNDAVPTIDSLITQIKHVIKVGGIDSVGIANDYSLSGEQSLVNLKNNNAEGVKGYLPWWTSRAKMGVLGFDRTPQHVVIPELNNISRMNTIYQKLSKSGFTSGQVEKIMGGNWVRVLSTV
ncbi:MAG TPA: membrane dipeptidase [Pyrinomonadaceae bacterium]|nr:membrane dipeptidase [Pyrinomonadaceae bacterium]